MTLPIHQVRKGQPRPAQVFIQPDTKVMQGHLRRQARLKPAELMGPLSVQAGGVRALPVDRLHDLPHPCQPAPQRLGPRGLIIPLRRTDDLGLAGLPPRALVRPPLKALIDHIGAKGWAPHTRQPRVRLTTQGKEGDCQRLILGTGWAKAKASQEA